MSDWERALRLLAREVELRELGRSLELVPIHRKDADALFTMASCLRLERLQLLVRAGVLEP